MSRKEFDDATSSRQLAEASVQQATAAVRQADLNLSYTAVNAPVAGITGRATHSVGTLITTDSAGSLLTTINQLTPIWVRFSLAESDLARIPGGRIGRDSPLDVQVLFSDGTPYAGKGRLNFAATAIDTRLGTQQLRAEFDNPREQLLPGMFVKVSIGAGQRDNVFLVPQAAVIQTEKANLVFVVDGDGKAQARTVQTGDWLGTDWGIVAGLKAGDRVIVDNLQKVRPGVAVTEARRRQPRRRRQQMHRRASAMSFSAFFINRPIFAGVISIIITLAGLIASQVLPIAQYPEIAPPTVVITANYPGASAETLARTVAAPIEEQLSGVENLIYYNSTASTNGTLTINCTFEVELERGQGGDRRQQPRRDRFLPRLPDVVRQAASSRRSARPTSCSSRRSRRLTRAATTRCTCRTTRRSTSWTS